MEATPERSNVIRCEIRQPGPSIATTPIRTAKAKAIAKLSEVIKIQKPIKNEKEEQRHGRLEGMRKRQLERVKNENEGQRQMWVEDIQHRTSEGSKNGNEEQ